MRRVDEILKLVGARHAKEVMVGPFRLAVGAAAAASLSASASAEAAQAAARFHEQHRVAKCGRVETAITVDEMQALESAGAQPLRH